MKSGLPLTVCAQTVLTLVPDDVVALALNAKADDGATTINTVAFLRRAGESDLVDVEELTFGDLMALVSPTEPPTEQPAEPPTEPAAEPPTERAFSGRAPLGASRDAGRHGCNCREEASHP
jgi:hypothetical protein